METPHAIRGMSLRAKLVAIFIAIKVVPLVLLAVFAWSAARDLGQLVTLRAVSMSDVMRDTQMRTGQTAIDDAIDALDDRSREAIETLTTATARSIAQFLRERDTEKAARGPPFSFPLPGVPAFTARARSAGRSNGRRTRTA